MTTEAPGCYSAGDQMTVVRQLHPEAVSLALGELILGLAAAGEAAAFLRWPKRASIAPQYILYTPNDVARFQALRRRGVIAQRPPFALFVLGGYAGPRAMRPRDMLPCLEAHDAGLPPGAVHVRARLRADRGRARRPHRAGFENNLWRSDGVLAAGNAELVERVVAGARLLGRQPADIGATSVLLAASAC